MNKTTAIALAGGVGLACAYYAVKKSKAADESWHGETQIIDGNATRKVMLAELKVEVAAMKAMHGIVPGLAVVIVGERKDSQAYVRMKKKAAKDIGFHSVDVEMPGTATQAEILAEVKRLNADPQVHGILVQLPLPDGIDQDVVLKSIDVEKDADGFHPLNVGNMWISGGEPPLAVACTPAGCLELLQRYDIKISGKNCVVLGRSNIVGMPMACLLQSANGTVTCCHSRTKDIESKVRAADIIIVAIGKPEFVRGDWVKPGAVVIDVGIHQVPDKSKKSGYSFVGDVCFKEVAPKCSFITPVPGGVGPMTITMLMKNTLNLARHSLGLERIHLRKSPSHVNIAANPTVVKTN
mmetsp:Transcript_45641/g.103058  ORF Transcript_45641/g.103058 Transcript_45641/m.103058 type:complete len:352 (-) Transcript_45641:270-1325(-)|eukprot:CAMPEP_0172613136 /NCGR_PEP_ID=MMETSP1068-20121228/40488_1 /TAXON_ID=35684 /ORGANISM="Pseudopedinella elastica, Strain CCMP716" /LENGTH=351 /DNA_ID=CAMNT_0013417509 /DNA_START=78 /DNA_END=1133 /DNA_ORIENTATION=+